jgi:hypothetical protein
VVVPNDDDGGTGGNETDGGGVTGGDETDNSNKNTKGNVGSICVHLILISSVQIQRQLLF